MPLSIKAFDLALLLDPPVDFMAAVRKANALRSSDVDRFPRFARLLIHEFGDCAAIAWFMGARAPETMRALAVRLQRSGHEMIAEETEEWLRQSQKRAASRSRG